MNGTTLIREYRGNVIENTHHGHVCVLDMEDGTIQAAGDATHMTYLRSSAKPFQAIPAIAHGIVDHYSLTSEEVAMMAASHRGEPIHVHVLEKMMNKIGVDESQLRCPASIPLHEASRQAYIREKKQARRLVHNCAGKHLGMLGLCKMKGYSLEGYWKVDHPLQQEMIQVMQRIAEISDDELHIAVDGCGVPVFAMPLVAIARMYGKLARPERIGNVDDELAAKTIVTAMHAHPELIAGTDFICSTLLQDENIVAKGGAQGVYCLGLVQEQKAIALKVMTGSEAPWPLIVAHILETLQYENTELVECLRKLHSPVITNDHGTAVGKREVCVTLSATQASNTSQHIDHK